MIIPIYTVKYIDRRSFHRTSDSQGTLTDPPGARVYNARLSGVAVASGPMEEHGVVDENRGY